MYDGRQGACEHLAVRYWFLLAARWRPLFVAILGQQHSPGSSLSARGLSPRTALNPAGRRQRERTEPRRGGEARAYLTR